MTIEPPLTRDEREIAFRAMLEAFGVDIMCSRCGASIDTAPTDCNAWLRPCPGAAVALAMIGQFEREARL